LKKLEAEGSPATTRQLAVYPLRKVDPAPTLELLKTLLPDARLAIDNETKSLIALAVPADQEVITRTLDQL
ncbi:MAG: hypothetical protein GTO53_04945, partial [Planctomycetales bacterium]|nr:hypothetical protein [Planctomycetales bacterium]NIO46085.1 hypothetical protein [Planctomycetales bacterium]